MKYTLILILLCLPVFAYSECTDAQLGTELVTDPNTLGYATAYGKPITTNSTGNDQAVLTVINQVRQGAAYQIQRSLIASSEVTAQFDPTEFNTLTQVKLNQIMALLSALQVDFSSQNQRDIWFNGPTPIFGPGNTKQAMIAMVKRQGSRAEILCGSNRTLDQISRAIRGQ